MATGQGHVLSATVEKSIQDRRTSASRLSSTPIIANRADRGGFPFLGCIETLYLRVSLIILNENSIPTIRLAATFWGSNNRLRIQPE